MLCKKLNANKVYLTDHDQCSLQHMLEDIQTNNVDVEVVKLDWFHFNKSMFSTEFFTSNSLRIVAGDVLYKQILIEPFFTVIEQLLLVPDSKMLLCHVPRAGVIHSDVIDAASDSLIATDTWLKQEFTS